MEQMIKWKNSEIVTELRINERWVSPIIIKVESRLAYYEALDKADTTEDYSDFIYIYIVHDYPWTSYRNAETI